MKAAVLVSGNGTNLQALIDAEKKGRLGRCRIALVVSDREQAHALERARRAGIDTAVIEPLPGQTREEFDRAMLDRIEEKEIELVLLAGFMRVLSPVMVKAFIGRILNIHPALLPAFKGLGAIQKAYEYGVKVTGVTVHVVDEGVDTGPILLQGAVEIGDEMTLEELEDEIHKKEHELYPEAVRLFSESLFRAEGRKMTRK